MGSSYILQKNILNASNGEIALEFEPYLRSIIDAQNASPSLQDVLAYSVTNGGKRLRPLLVKASGNLYDIPFQKLYPVAAAIELIHAYSLIHDDLPCMDNSPLRRGEPSCWKKFGEAQALLAGDALLTLAFETIASANLQSTIVVELVLTLTRIAGPNGLIAGQWLDIMQIYPFTVEGIQHMQSLKTGTLMGFCCQVGAIVSNCDSEEKTRLYQTGQELGILYQIKDDLFDVCSNMHNLGKPANSDGEKVNIVSMLGVQEAESCLQEQKIKLFNRLESFGEKADLLKAIIEWAVYRSK